MVRTGECQQVFMPKSEAQDKVLEITKEICRTLIQEEELKKASKDKKKVVSDENLIVELKAEYDGDVLSNIIDKVLIYNDKDIEVVFKGENFIRNAV